MPAGTMARPSRLTTSSSPLGVLQSQEFAQAGQPASTYLSQLWSSVTAEKVDETTVRFRLQQPLASFLSETTIGMLPEHLWKDVAVADMPQSMLNLEPVGTGPWRLIGDRRARRTT